MELLQTNIAFLNGAEGGSATGSTGYEENTFGKWSQIRFAVSYHINDME